MDPSALLSEPLVLPELPFPELPPPEERLFLLSSTAIWVLASGEALTPWTVPMESLALLEPPDPFEEPVLPLFPPFEEALLFWLSSTATWLSIVGVAFTPCTVPIESLALLVPPLEAGSLPPLLEPLESERLFLLSSTAAWVFASGAAFTPCTVPIESFALLAPLLLEPAEPPLAEPL